jgi:hypothetical protein
LARWEAPVQQDASSEELLDVLRKAVRDAHLRWLYDEEEANRQAAKADALNGLKDGTYLIGCIGQFPSRFSLGELPNVVIGEAFYFSIV